MGVKEKVAQLLSGKVIVGHGLEHDMEVLSLKPPKNMIRDTATFRRLYINGKTPSLKRLAFKYLREDIQNGEHDSLEDARAALKIYLKFRNEWEASLEEVGGRNYIGQNKYNGLQPVMISNRFVSLENDIDKGSNSYNNGQELQDVVKEKGPNRTRIKHEKKGKSIKVDVMKKQIEDEKKKVKKVSMKTLKKNAKCIETATIEKPSW